MSRLFPIAALALCPLLVVACENKPASAPSSPAAPSAAAAKPAGKARTIGFQLVSATPVGALQFDVAYAGEGRFVGDGDAVACEAKLEDALASYNHLVADKTLRLAFVAVKGFAGPVRIAQCEFQGEAKPEDFKITVRDASNPDLEALDPPPTIQTVLD
jgi:hypothetical protein